MNAELALSLPWLEDASSCGYSKMENPKMDLGIISLGIFGLIRQIPALNFEATTSICDVEIQDKCCCNFTAILVLNDAVCAKRMWLKIGVEIE